jgi:hypothetical protein
MIDAPNSVTATIRLSDGTIIKGMVNIHKYNRLVDFFNAKESDQFVIICDAEISASDAKIIVINRNNIIWAVPEV